MKKILSILLLAFFVLSPIKLQAATASFFTSGGGTVYTGSQFSVTVYANGSEAYNAVSVTVNFSNLTLTGVSAAGGWTGVSGPTHSGNTVTYSGALLGSSATGSRAVLNLSFRAPYSPGSASIGSSGTIALADGNGTQVPGGGNTVGYTIVAPPPPPDPVPEAVVVTSDTHADPEKWYSNRNVNLSWNKQDGVDGFSFEFNQTHDTVPDDTSEGTDQAKSYGDLADGAYYFHIKAHNSIGWGATTHFRVLVDTTPPDPFGIAKLENEAGDKYALFFYTNDTLSGLDYFNVTVDDVDLGRQQTRMEIDKNAYVVVVTAYDKAGNSRSEKFIINEPIASAPMESSFVFDWKSAVITICCGGLIALLVLLAFIIYKRYKDKQAKPATKSTTPENKTATPPPVT